MSSKPSDVLATVFLWVCFCIASLIVFKGLFGDEKPSTPPTTLSHNYIEPQAVLPQPLWSFDLPPPRERPEPTFAPRPEPEPLPRRNGLIPRAERRVRPAVPPGRRVQRERPLTEMSTGERVAAAEKEAAREAREAQEEQESHWRSKAAASERKQEATSRTGGERKPLNINMGAADSYPRKTQDVKIERPAYEGSNAFTGTALGGEKGTAYASPMDVDGAGGAAQPLVGEAQESDDTPADSTTTVPEENQATKRPLTGGAQKSDPTPTDNTSMVPGANDDSNQPLAGEVQQASDVVPGHSSATAETQSDNPLLKMNDEDAANGLETELSSLQKSQANGEADDSWDRKVLWVYTSWLEWITSGNTLKWNFDKLNEARIQRHKPMVEEVFTALDNRCGKRNHDVPAGALDDTLAVVSVVRDNMNEALDHLQGKNLGQPVTQDQIPSATGEQSTSEGQSADDERLKQLETSRDQEFAELLQKRQEVEAAQIARDRESAKALDLQLKQRKDAHTASDHETAKSLFLQQEQEAALLYEEVYMQDDPVDQQTRTTKRNYPETAVASGSGTYPKNGQASRRVVPQVPDSPILPPPFKLPRHKVVTLASEQTVAADPALTDGAQDSNYTPPAEDATMALDEQTNTSPISPPANPLLGLQPSQAWATLDSWLDEANSTFSTLTNDDAEEWFQKLKMALTSWSEMMERGGKELWVPLKGPDVFRFANFASSTRQLIERQFGAASKESVNVCEWMKNAKNHVEEHERQARIKEEEWVRRTELQQQEQARINEEARQEDIRMAQVQQQQEQARIDEEERQKSMSMAQAQQQQQQQQQPQLGQNPPAEDDVDLYGSDPHGEAQQKASMAKKKLARAEAERNAAHAEVPKIIPAAEPSLSAQIRKEIELQNAQPDADVQQQPPTQAAGPGQQAAASSATNQQPPRATTGLSQSRWNRTSNNKGRGRTNVGRARPINTPQRQPNPPPAGGKEDEKVEKSAEVIQWADFRQNALDEGWRDDDLYLGGGVRPLDHECSQEAALVLVTTWLQLNNEIVRNFQRHFTKSQYKDTVTSMLHGPIFMGNIRLITARYRQLRDYACKKRGEDEVYDWNLEKISLSDIKEDDLEQLISKNQEFMLALKEAVLEEDDTEESQKVELDACRNIVLVAYTSVMSVSRSIRRITSPASNDDSESDLSDADPSVKAAIAKEDAKSKAARSN